MRSLFFLDDNGTFTIERPENYSGLYFPIAGTKGLKGAITPNLNGDSKINQNAFLMEPVSIQNLNNNKSGRNFWCRIDEEKVWSATGASAEQESRKFTSKQDESEIKAGFMWHELTRNSDSMGLKSQITSFVALDHNVEVMYVTIENVSDDTVEFRPTAAIPVFGRSADNIRDHRHVTSLLHRISTDDYGVKIKPTLSFDERGHRRNELTYFVEGVAGDGSKPVDFYPVLDDFIGEGGSLINPRSIVLDSEGVKSGSAIAGKEAVGGIRFEKAKLAPGEKATYTIIMGITDEPSQIAGIVDEFNSDNKVISRLESVKKYWTEQVNVSYKTGNASFDGFMKWVSFQPLLRRIYGCSFLPHHDYGRGGRGWRDLWQDCLSLLIMDPSGVRQMIVDNYGGVRIDGTNATIIGEKQGEFIADRNGIARVWMDHGVWPFMTTMLYINQTGDVDVLKETATYFKDEQNERGTSLDSEWNEEYGVCQRDTSSKIYKGSVLEHMLLEQMCSFYEVGSHNHIKLRGADWNDALDMAAENGESVAFTCAFAGNMDDFADLLDKLNADYGWEEVEVLEEISTLLDADKTVFDSIEAKTEVLKKYLSSCGHNVSGNRICVKTTELAANLREKAAWIKEHIRKTEWIDGENNSDEGWFNSYYDNSKNRVEGFFPTGVRMMLTGQVFSIMSKTATDEQVTKICKAADNYLYKQSVGGYRLNTDFKEEKFDLGRMFGFAYGEKENGAVFSHMTVMYANALYKRGFVKEGYKALQTLADTAMDFDTSKIYPGIPEYFDGDGRGLYNYLTGAASWYMLTFITEVFGVRGEYGNLSIQPKLVKNQFDDNMDAVLSLTFAGKQLVVKISNPENLEYGEYRVVSAECDGTEFAINEGKAELSREAIEKLNDSTHTINIKLGK